MYEGFHPSKSWTPERISDYNPQQIYKKFIATRTPFILTSIPEGIDLSWLTIENLVEKQGERTIQVEQKKNGTFGNGGTRMKMKFADFIKDLPKGNLYLTTQYVESLEESEEIEEEIEINSDSEPSMDEEESLLPSFAAPPLDGLLPDIPYKLELFSGMILHQMNLWIGHADEKGLSSGLHMDFHDNFYFLQRGRKRFTIFSPKDAEQLYIHGSIREIHPNGLFEFASTEERIRADGAFLSDVAKWKVDKAEEKLDAATTDAEIAAAEQELEDVYVLN
jgi:hypothetical protein